jgi:hypothetical protein
MFTSCSQFAVADNSGEEIGSIYNAIQQVASETKVDHRFILAVILQESGGCVRVPTTNWGVRNPGLMQDHDGAATCNSDVAQSPCPQETITQMIQEGSKQDLSGFLSKSYRTSPANARLLAAGTSSGDGLANCLNEATGTAAQAYYQAARIYNSGSIAASGLLQDGIATHCYSSDIANRLTGWLLAPHACTLDG